MIFEDVEPTPKMQVALSKVFGPLKDHPSKAVPRAGGDDMLGVIEMRHEPNEPGAVRVDGRAAVAVAAVALRPLLQRPAQPGRRAARGRGSARGRSDRLRRRHRALRRDLARGARPDRGRDRDLRDGRDHGEPPVRPAGRFRRGRAGRERRRRDDRVRGPAPRAAPRGLDSELRARRCCTSRGWMAKGIEGREDRRRRRTARRGVRRDRRGGEGPQLLPSVAADRHGHLGQLASASTRCRGCRPNTRGACTARPSRATTASADSRLHSRRTPNVACVGRLNWSRGTTVGPTPE